MQLALSLMKKEPPKHRAALVFWFRFGTIPIGSGITLQGTADNRVSVRLNDSISFPQSTTMKLKWCPCNSHRPNKTL
jgi:hypothetical protein